MANEDPIAALREMMGVKVNEVQAENPELFDQKKRDLPKRFDEKYWMKKGLMQPYSLGKTFAGMQNDGNVKEFLTRFCNMFMSYSKVNAEKSGRKIQTEMFDILKSTMFCIYKMSEGDETARPEDSEKFLAMLSGFFQSYMNTTALSVEDS